MINVLIRIVKDRLMLFCTPKKGKVTSSPLMRQWLQQPLYLENENMSMYISEDEKVQIRKDFTLPADVVDKLSKLRVEMHNTTNSNVITTAITVLDQIIAAKQKGEIMYIHDEKGNKTKVWIT